MTHPLFNVNFKNIMEYNLRNSLKAFTSFISSKGLQVVSHTSFFNVCKRLISFLAVIVFKTSVITVPSLIYKKYLNN